MRSPARPAAAATGALVAIPGTRLGRWMAAIRPKTLTIALTPVAVGTALAWRDAGVIAFEVLVATLFGALLIQIGTNLHNDAADHERGADEPGRRLGPPRATAEGWLRAGDVRLVATVSFLLALLVGCYLIVLGGWPIAALGLACVLAGLSYSGGPRPISHSPLGELFVLLFFGLAAVGGTYYLQSGTLATGALLAGLAVGFPAAAVLTVNNHRDRAEDRLDGRRTLAILVGERASGTIYAALVLAPFALVPWLAAGSGGWGWLPVACAPWALGLCRRLRGSAQPEGRALNRLLADTARFQLAFGGSLVVAWLAPIGLA